MILTDFVLLKSKMKTSGMTVKAIAEKSGILRETLYNRLNGKGEFTASEITSLSRELHLNNEERDRIFFEEKVE